MKRCGVAGLYFGGGRPRQGRLPYPALPVDEDLPAWCHQRFADPIKLTVPAKQELMVDIPLM